MHNPDDMELLRAYAENGSEEAFHTLVRRHIDIVYSAALRQVGNPALAQDVTQATFIILARKVNRIHREIILVGWLYSTTRFVASRALRADCRRKKNEEAFAQMNQEDGNAAWDRIEPLLDEAMASLRDKDRNAILLRYFQNKSLREVAVSLGIQEQAAQKRIERAVDKLRSLLAKRGATSTAAVLTGVLCVNAAQAAPHAAINLSGALTPASIIGTSLSELANECFRAISWQKAKIIASATLVAPIVIVAAVLLAGMATGAPEMADSRQPSLAFEASGFLEIDTYRTGVVIRTFTRPFHVAVQNGKSLIRVDPADGEKAIAYSEYGWNGTNGFNFVVFNGTSRAQNDSTLNITLRPEPLEDSLFGAIWIAFCANNLFTNESSIFLQNFVLSRDMIAFLNAAPPPRFRAEGVLDKEAPFLLKSFNLLWDVEDESQVETMLPEYRSNKPIYSFAVQSWKRAHGLHVPEKFDLIQFSYPTNQQTARFVYRGILTNLVNGTTRTNFVPTLGKRTRVLDERFASYHGPFEYSSTNGTILDQPEDVAEKQRQQRAASAERARKKRAAKQQKELEQQKRLKP